MRSFMKQTTTALAALAVALTFAVAPAPTTAQVTPTVMTNPDFIPQIERGAVDVPRGSILIQNLDSVWTAAGDVLAGVDILIRDGVIREIGPDIRAPRGVKTVDGSGYTAIPGIVDPHTHIAMATTNECTSPIVPEVRVIDILDPTQLGILHGLTGGVTTAHILHGSCNPIGGQNAIIKTRWGVTDPLQLLVQGAPQTVKFALGENVTRKNWGGDGPTRFPFSRQGVEAIYNEAFTAARAYQAEWDRYREHPRDFRVPPRRDLRLEALAHLLNGDYRIVAHSYRADEILMLMDVADRFGFKVDCFTHVLEGYKVADEMAAHGACGSTFSDWWHYKLEAFDAIPYNAAIMADHGVHTSLNSDSEELEVFALYEIQKPVRYGGVSEEEALRMYTLYPAQQLLLGDRIGSLEEGKDGDVVLLSGDPFDTHTTVEQTIVDGIVYWDRSAEAEYRRSPMRPMDVNVTRTEAPTVAWANSRTLENEGDEMAAPGNQDMAPDNVFALVGATVHPVDGPAIENGAVVVRNGRIEAVGPASSVSIPAGAERIQVTGHLWPGMTDVSTGLGLQEIGQVQTATDQQETGTFNPHLRAMIGLQPHSVTYGVARMNGITSVVTAQQSGVIPGAGSLLQLNGDTPQRLSIDDRAAMVINFPRPNGDSWDEPKLEGDDLEALVDLFHRAEMYNERPTTRDEADMPFEAQVRGGERLMLEALVPVVTGQMPAFFRVSGERGIRTLLLFLDEFPAVKPVIIGGADAWRVADELGQRGIPVALNTGNSVTGDRDDPIDAAWSDAAVLYQAGVPVAVTTTDISLVRNLPYYAARHWAYGLPHDAAVRAVTLTPAEIMGLGGEMGSITPGKRADLILTDGDLLEITTHVNRMWIDGNEVNPRDNKHDRLYDEFKDRNRN